MLAIAIFKKASRSSLGTESIGISMSDPLVSGTEMDAVILRHAVYYLVIAG